LARRPRSSARTSILARTDSRDTDLSEELGVSAPRI
jgi:hypothetical protein